MSGMEWADLAGVLGSLGASVLVGGLVGIERRIHGHWADPRTYMSVSMGAAIFAIIGRYAAASDPAAVTRVVQGIAAGIGFLGAGTILKLSDKLEIKGLTTAGSVWLTAALGTAAGLALYPLVIAGTAVSLLVLAALRPIEKRLETSKRDTQR